MTQSVLVVEDDPIIRKGIVLLLRAKGHSVAFASSVAEAASSLDAATPTHLLLDLNLPDGTGDVVLRRVRAESLPVRVALVTGGIDTVLLDETCGIGVEAVFIKPPDWDKVLDWIDAA